MEPVREGSKKLNVSAQNAPEHTGIIRSGGSEALSLAAAGQLLIHFTSAKSNVAVAIRAPLALP
jgi:hypothetical protein